MIECGGVAVLMVMGGLDRKGEIGVWALKCLVRKVGLTEGVTVSQG